MRREDETISEEVSEESEGKQEGGVPRKLLRRWLLTAWTKMRGAAGPDRVTAEMLRAGGVELREWVFEVMRTVWRLEEATTSWVTDIVAAVYKRGNSARLEAWSDSASGNCWGQRRLTDRGGRIWTQRPRKRSRTERSRRVAR